MGQLMLGLFLIKFTLVSCEEGPKFLHHRDYVAVSCGTNSIYKKVSADVVKMIVTMANYTTKYHFHSIVDYRANAGHCVGKRECQISVDITSHMKQYCNYR